MRRIIFYLLLLLTVNTYGQRAGVIASSGSASSSLLNGLVSTWNFDQSSGNSVDLVGSNTLTASNITYSNAGKFNTCLTFNGTSSKLTSSQVFTSASAWSVLFWVKDCTGPILNSIDFDNSRGIYIVTSSGQVEVYVNGSAIDFYMDYSSFNNGSWHSIILTYDGANVRSYRDGVADQYRALTNYSATTNPFIIGWDGVSYYSGSIDNPAFAGRAWTQSEITELQTTTHPFN